MRNTIVKFRKIYLKSKVGSVIKHKILRDLSLAIRGGFKLFAFLTFW